MFYTERSNEATQFAFLSIFNFFAISARVVWSLRKKICWSYFRIGELDIAIVVV